jgi:hypothetical protein
MDDRNIDFEEVMVIRKGNRNPDVTFAPGLKYRDLINKNYKEMVEIFTDRLNRWYFKVAEQLSEKQKEIEGLNFTVMILDCISIDLLSQYYYGLKVSNGTKFIDFFRKNLSSCNYKLKRLKKSCIYSERDRVWKKVYIKDIAEAIFYGFRCGLIHSGRILEYGRINELYTEPITIKEWDSDKNKSDIHVNPKLLLKEIKKTFEIYVDKLRNSKDKELKDNFIKKIKFDYGIDLGGNE